MGAGMSGGSGHFGREIEGRGGQHDLVAFDVDKLKPLWHAHIGRVQNAPETYMLAGRQYILVAASGSVYAFYLQ